MKTLLFTGASGFLGNNIIDDLNEIYSVDTLGFATSDTYYVDISTSRPELRKNYDIILHAAGKAHVIPKNDKEEQEFYDTNYKGTKNLCESLKIVGPPKSFIFISTVAVYGLEEGNLINEDFPLNGDTPYAKSKILAEQFLKKWCKNHAVKLTILRPSLLAGKNPPGNLYSMLNGIKNNRYFSIAGGKSRKSIAMANDIAKLIPLCVENDGIYNLCDSHNPSFHELEKLICSQVNKKKPINIPYPLALIFAKIGDFIGSNAPINTLKLDKITKSLTFSNKKIINELGFIPSDVLSNFIIE